METKLSSPKNPEDLSFEIFRKTKFNALDHSLYDVIADARLDKLSFDERMAIFDGWHEDMNLHQLAYYHRYALNGCSTEREVVDTARGRTIRMTNFASNDYLNMKQHPSVINAAITALVVAVQPCASVTVTL